MEKTTTKKKINIKEIIGSPYTIVVVLIGMVIALLVYTRFLVKANTLYMFSGFIEDYSFFEGTIYEGMTVNHFGDSKVLYTGEDVDIYDYEVGYYIKDDKYIPISVVNSYDIKGDEKQSASLKSILTGTSFSFTETHKDAVYLSKENLEKLDKLVFLIRGKDKDGEEIQIEVPLEVEKITK